MNRKELKELKKKLKEDKKILIESYKVIEEMEKYSCEYDYDAKNYYIFYNHLLKSIVIGFDTYKQRTDIYFSSRNKVEEAIKHIGLRRILKYYLRVKG